MREIANDLMWTLYLTMKLYLLDDPVEISIHPRFSHIGTWSVGKTCTVCCQSDQHLIEPLLVEWDDGSVNIGDFSWCGYTAVVLDHVRDWLIDKKFEVRFGSVEVVLPTGRAKMPRVKFPYTGPHLNWLVTTKKIKLDEQNSGILPIPDCRACGKKRTQFVRNKIFIPKENWKGEKIFEIEQNGLSGALFVVEEALDQLVNARFSNFLAVPAGKIGN